MKNRVLGYIIGIAGIVVLIGLALLVVLCILPKNEQGRETANKENLLLWYYDDSLTDFVKAAASAYESENEITVDYELVSSIEFFEDINLKNASGERTPDLYITDTTQLEKAYLGSLSEENAYPELYTEKNFYQRAIDAVTYKGILVAYPLSFDTAFLAYNTDYVNEAPEIFLDIYDVQTDNSENENIDCVISYDKHEILSNFYSLGNSLILGGNSGDNISEFKIDKDLLMQAMYYYQSFPYDYNVFADVYEEAAEKFLTGKSIYSILTVKSLKALSESSVNYSICKIPDYSNTIKTKTLSTTLCVCVNPFSADEDGAASLAKFMTYDFSDNILDTVSQKSCRRNSNSSAEEKIIAEIYEESAILPKLIKTEGLWSEIKSFLNHILSGGDIEECVDSLEENLNEALTSTIGAD